MVVAIRGRDSGGGRDVWFVVGKQRGKLFVIRYMVQPDVRRTYFASHSVGRRPQANGLSSLCTSVRNGSSHLSLTIFWPAGSVIVL